MRSIESKMCSTKFLSSIGLALLALVVTTSARAVHNDGTFQIEGDVCGGGSTPITAACVDVPTTADDWDTIFSCTGAEGNCVLSGNAPNARSPHFVYDPGNQSIFTGGGSKDQLDITQWLWKDGSVPDKDNIIEAMAAVYKPASGPRMNHKILYFGANRFAVNGDAQIGFWFFQDTVARTNVSSQGGFKFSGQHRIGDILILSNFVQGGGQSNIQVFVVSAVNPANGDVTFDTTLGANTTNGNQVCLGINNDTACAATNGAISPALDSNFTPKSGATKGNYPVVGFFEGGIDLTEAGQLIGRDLGGECFGSFLVETRSSQSISAVLKDFTLGELESCRATADTEIHLTGGNHTDIQNTTIPAGSVIHDKINVRAGDGNPGVTGTATFTFFSNGTCDPGTNNVNVVFVDALKPLGAPSGTPFVSTVESINTAALAPGNYSFKAQYNGDGANYPAIAVAACEPITVSSPSVSVSKTCTAAVNAAGTGVVVNYSGQVCAGTSEALHNVTLTDSQDGTVENPPAGTIAAGACVPYSGTYSSTSVNNSDTVTVNALGAAGFAVQAQQTASCSAILSPSITIDKTCSAAVNNAGDGVDVTFSNGANGICNTGNVQLTITSLVNNKPSPGTPVTPAATVLAPNQCTTYGGTYASSTLANTDTMSVTANGALGAGAVSNTGSASCTATVNPLLEVTKSCTNVLVLNTTGTKLEVQVNISGTVCNKGDVVINGVTATDTDAGSVLSSTNLAKNQCVPYAKAYNPVSLSGTGGNAADTVTATGTAALSSATVSANRSANCDLCPLPEQGAP